MKIILATTNRHKIREIQHILKGVPVQLLSMLDLAGVPRVKEDGSTFEENSAKKARAFAKKFNMISLADDSGLEVRELGGQPGIRSARFAGPDSTREKLCRKVLRLLEGVPPGRRKARFVCCIAIAAPGKAVRFAKGYVYGRITDRMMGENGFGYDPIFIPDGYKKTFAQMKPAAKNRLSHRAMALEKAKIILKNMVKA